MEISFVLSNGQTLRGVVNSPGAGLRAGVLLVHGLGEHIGRYDELVKRLSEKNIAFTAVDLPGHGRSDGRRGVIKNYAIVHEMIDTLSREFRMTFPGIPLFLYGHSLGGGIVLDYIISKQPEVKGAIVTSPWIRLSFEPGKSKVTLARIMNSILPSLVQPSGLVVDHISHDSSVVEKYKNDPLVHGKISVGLFHSAVSAAKNIQENAFSLKVPMLLMHGAEDQITSPEGSREIAARSTGVTLKIWDGGYHELHNELFREEVYTYILNWLDEHI